MAVNSGFVRAFIRAPMLRAAVPFMLALFVARWRPLPLAWGWSFLALGLAVWLWAAFRHRSYAARWVHGAAFFLLVFAFGLLWQALHNDRAFRHHVDHFQERATGWELEVNAPPVDHGRTVRAWTVARAALVDGTWQPATGGVLLTLLTDSTRALPGQGDKLVVKAAVEPIARVPVPGGFDVRQWAAGRGVFHQAFAPAGRWRQAGDGHRGPDLFEQARTRINAWLRASGLPDRDRALVKALLLGQRDELDTDQTQAFVRSGTIHVLAVSGAHVGIIYAALLWALVWLAKDLRGRLVRGLAALLVLWWYAGLTEFAPSVLRATVMFSMFTMAEMTRWRVEPLNNLAASAVLLLLWDPSMLFQLSFQLSFLAVLGIVVFYGPLHRLWEPPNGILRFLWSIAAVTIVAQAFTLPLCLYVFQAFPLWFLPANMAIVGLITVAVYVGIALVALHAVPVLGPMVAALMKGLLLLLGFLSGFFAGLPSAYPALRVGWWGMLGLYVLVACIGAWAMGRKLWARQAALATVAALFLGWAWTARQRNAQRAFVAYPQRDGFTCAFVEGRTLHLFSTGMDEHMERHVGEHVRHAGIRQVTVERGLPGMVTQAGRRYVFLSGGDGRGMPAAASGAALVLCGQGQWHRDTLGRMGAGEWVLGSDLDGSARWRLRKQAHELGIPVFDMRVSGAYVRP